MEILWFSEIQKRVVEKASQKNLKLVVFAQDDLAEQKIFDYIYQYGIPKSINDGYYSLFYLSQIISELIYKVRFLLYLVMFFYNYTSCH